jgi:hypothetical protein
MPLSKRLMRMVVVVVFIATTIIIDLIWERLTDGKA